MLLRLHVGFNSSHTRWATPETNNRDIAVHIIHHTHIHVSGVQLYQGLGSSVGGLRGWGLCPNWQKLSTRIYRLKSERSGEYGSGAPNTLNRAFGICLSQKEAEQSCIEAPLMPR